MSCEDVIPDDEEERALAELRILEASLARHHDGIRAAAERGEAYVMPHSLSPCVVFGNFRKDCFTRVVSGQLCVCVRRI